MLLGEFKHTVDSKNRMFVPAKFREELGETFVVAQSMSGAALKLIAMSEWDNYIEPIKKLPALQREVAMRAMSRTAIQVTPDSQGRILLPVGLVEYAQIVRNAVVVGCGSYAEIWAEENYNVAVEDEDQEAIKLALEEAGL